MLRTEVDDAPTSGEDLPAPADVGMQVTRAPREVRAGETRVEPYELDAQQFDLWIRALGALVPLEFG
jgi:hypothetical protein